MNSLLTDLRYGLRTIRRAPGASLLAFVSLALGIGATTAIYSVARPALLAPPPYRDPSQLMMVWEREASGARSNVGWLTFADLGRESHSFSGSAAMSFWQPTLFGEGNSERLEGQRVSSGFFHVLGVTPILGRDFRPEEDRPGANHEAILSYGLWQRRYGGDSAVIGKPIPLGSVTYTVVGVLPPDFESVLAPGAQIWAPLGYDASFPPACRTCRHLRMVARLAPGIATSDAEREVSDVFGGIASQFPDQYASQAMTLQPLHDYVTQASRPAMLALLAAVAFVVLIACADAGNLLFGRALRREGEFAIRAALGAGRGRLVRMMVGESIILTGAAGIAGVLLAVGGTRLLVQLAPPGIPRLDQARVDGSVLLFALALTGLTGLLAAVPSALAARRSDLQGTLRVAARGMAPAARRTVRSVLVVAEVALAVMLLAGAALLFQGLGRLLAVDTGFQPAGRLAVEAQVSGSRYVEDAPVWQFWTTAVSALRATPGVIDAAAASQIPLGGNFDGYSVHLEDHPNANPELDPGAQRYAVTPGYLRTIGIPLLRGRDIAASDREDAPRVVVINQTMATKLWPGEDPIGRRLRMGGTDGPWFTVVGIAGDAHHVSLDEKQPYQVYVPTRQWYYAENGMTIVVHVTGNAENAVPAVRRALLGVEPTVAVAKVSTLSSLVAGVTANRRFALALFEAFALLALVLAGAGIYGVLSAAVLERRREIGIRSALGASRRRIVGLVAGRGLVLAAVGLLFGTLGTLALGRLLAGLLYDIAPSDPASLVFVAATLAAVTAAACTLPAWRATRVDPAASLREG